MPDPMTPERRAELRARAELAKPFVGYDFVAPPFTTIDAADLHALLDAADERDRLRTWQERVALAAGIGDEMEGRGIHLEADPDVAADHMAGVLAMADTHDECPIHCGRCGETLADVWCDHCHGSGCGPGTASGAYEECEWCAGVGKVHLGCADLCYAALVAERDRLAAAVERVRALHQDEGQSQGYFPGDRDYGERDHCCGTCGTCGEYGVEWPCPTVAALDGAEQ